MKACIFLFLLISIFSIGELASAQTYAETTVPRVVYEPVVQIPGLDPNTQGTDQYVNALYLLSITVAALLAVVKIIFGGVKWMLSDVVTDKSSAKKDIWGAILGLLIVLSAVLILNTINKDLTKLNFLENASPLSITLGQHMPPPRTAADQCPDGMTFKITNEDPSGSCVHSIEIDQDFSDSPNEGNAYCSGIGIYNPETNQCDIVQEVQTIPTERLEYFEDNSGGDTVIFNQQAREWCNALYPGTTYDPDNKSCVPAGAL